MILLVVFIVLILFVLFTPLVLFTSLVPRSGLPGFGKAEPPKTPFRIGLLGLELILKLLVALLKLAYALIFGLQLGAQILHLLVEPIVVWGMRGRLLGTPRFPGVLYLLLLLGLLLLGREGITTTAVLLLNQPRL